MSNPNMYASIQRTIYSLKQRYGDEIQIYRLSSASTDYETGVKSATVSVIDIRKSVVLPAAEVRRFFASVAFLTASKQFLSPGNQGFDEGSRGFIIEARDVYQTDDTFEFQPEDWIVYKGHRYDVVNIEVLEDLGWMVMCKELKGTIPERVININTSNSLNFSSEQSGTVE